MDLDFISMIGSEGQSQPHLGCSPRVPAAYRAAKKYIPECSKILKMASTGGKSPPATVCTHALSNCQAQILVGLPKVLKLTRHVTYPFSSCLPKLVLSGTRKWDGIVPLETNTLSIKFKRLNRTDCALVLPTERKPEMHRQRAQATNKEALTYNLAFCHPWI